MYGLYGLVEGVCLNFSVSLDKKASRGSRGNGVTKVYTPHLVQLFANVHADRNAGAFQVSELN